MTHSLCETIDSTKVDFSTQTLPKTPEQAARQASNLTPQALLHKPPMNSDSIRRPLGTTSIEVSAVALGCWPISGMTSPDVTESESIATLEACADVGVNFLDTAYGYGAAGESERLIARALGKRRDDFVIATKGGIHWDGRGQRVIDGRPERLKQECDESLQRLQTDRVELLYLHAPDPQTPLEESAGGLRDLQRAGKALSIGVSNVDLNQLKTFHAVCPLAAYQPPYNMLQRDIEHEIVPWCRDQGISIMCYWPLMKGILAGKLARDHHFPTRDSRNKYPMYQGDEWQKNLDFVERLRAIAREAGCTVAQLVVGWTIHQPGITAALCGAKRPDQIRETASAMRLQLSPTAFSQIEQAIQARGTPVVRMPV